MVSDRSGTARGNQIAAGPSFSIYAAGRFVGLAPTDQRQLFPGIVRGEWADPRRGGLPAQNRVAPRSRAVPNRSAVDGVAKYLVGEPPCGATCGVGADF